LRSPSLSAMSSSVVAWNPFSRNARKAAWRISSRRRCRFSRTCGERALGAGWGISRLR
jgi:hypothetical protein